MQPRSATSHLRQRVRYYGVGVILGFTHGAPVVTSAAIIMMGVFGGFILGCRALALDVDEQASEVPSGESNG